MINGSATKSIEAVQEKVNNTRAGTDIAVTIMRSQDGEYIEMELTITLKDAKSLEKLNQSSGSGKEGNFGYQSGDSEQQGSEEDLQPDERTGDQDINDMLREFFNQFN